MRTQQNGKINIILHDEWQANEYGQSMHPRRSHKELQLIDHAFSEFIGLHSFKNHVKEIYAMKLIQYKREQLGLQVQNQSLHMIFKGNPGTGKTTVARKLASVFGDLNVLSRGHFIEAERADLVGEYIGQTAQKTRKLIQKALGGILFIDEAYALARGGNKDFGREAIDTLVKQIEDHHQEFILILAGYPREMDYFLELNPGLQSRFPFHMSFEDYSVNELIRIAHQITSEKEYTLSNKAVEKLRKHLVQLKETHILHFSNGRHIRNLIEESIRKQSMRLLLEKRTTLNELMEIKADDLQLKTDTDYYT